MTTSENLFRQWYRKTYPWGYIHKIPDFKATGASYGAGLPDYLTINAGIVIFYEVKKWNAKSFTPAQHKIFPKMIAAGAFIYIWIKEKRGHSIALYK